MEKTSNYLYESFSKENIPSFYIVDENDNTILEITEISLDNSCLVFTLSDIFFKDLVSEIPNFQIKLKLDLINEISFYGFEKTKNQIFIKLNSNDNEDEDEDENVFYKNYSFLELLVNKFKIDYFYIKSSKDNSKSKQISYKIF